MDEKEIKEAVAKLSPGMKKRGEAILLLLAASGPRDAAHALKSAQADEAKAGKAEAKVQEAAKAAQAVKDAEEATAKRLRGLAAYITKGADKDFRKDIADESLTGYTFTVRLGKLADGHERVTTDTPKRKAGRRGGHSDIVLDLGKLNGQAIALITPKHGVMSTAKVKDGNIIPVKGDPLAGKTYSSRRSWATDAASAAAVKAGGKGGGGYSGAGWVFGLDDNGQPGDTPIG